MTTHAARLSRQDAASVERALLARLGLGASASAQDVETAHEGLVEFLDTAPPELDRWASAQVASIDEAYALLSDPTIDRGTMMAAAAIDLIPPTDGTTAPATAATAAKAPRRASTVPTPVAPTAGRPPLVRRLAIGGAAIVAVVAIAIAGYNLNGGTGVPPMDGSPAPEAAASPAVDTAVVAELMQKIQANPKDVTSLQSLADAYYQANDFASAQTFLEKILAIDPKDLTALLALGAVQYNQGDAKAAEGQWRAALAIDDRNIDAHYYLGFMYLTQDPPDQAKARAEWDQVIAIDPDSDIAKNVAQHLNSLASAAPDASNRPAASPAPDGTAAPVASPAASPAAAGD